VRIGQPVERFPAQTDRQPPLWMETVIRDQRITRLWIHFTREGLLWLDPSAYQRDAALQGRPVPAGWSDGVQGILAEAEDDAAQEPDPPLVPLVGACALLLVGGPLGVWRWRSRRRPAARPTRGLIQALRKAQLARTLETMTDGADRKPLTTIPTARIVGSESYRRRPGRVRVRAGSENRERCEPVPRQTRNGPASRRPKGLHQTQ
jgi:hypothetical protein